MSSPYKKIIFRKIETSPAPKLVIPAKPTIFKTRDEKNAYVEDLKGKGLLSDAVFNQLVELKNSGY